MLTIQYLEDSPELASLRPAAVAEKLRLARDRVPFTHLLIGWHLPTPLLEACRAEAERLGVRFLRWQPVLTVASALQPSQDCRVMGLSGERVKGLQNLAEFTFVCPNHPQVQEEVPKRFENLMKKGVYQGFFLDRIRFPSPAANPFDDLGCFCEHCRRKATSLGLDLEEVRQALARRRGDAEGVTTLVLTLLGASPSFLDHQSTALIQRYLDFRSRTVTDLLSAVAAQLHAGGLEVGLDCYSPCLCSMVGQDLAALSAHVDWIKVMCYAHTFGPAGLPFELIGLCDFLAAATGLDGSQILRRMATALGRPLPASSQTLEESGVSLNFLQKEVEAGIRSSSVPILAGIELVEIPGVTRVNDTQLAADLEAVRAARPGGLSISWDLLRIPLHRLDVVREAYLKGQMA